MYCRRDAISNWVVPAQHMHMGMCPAYVLHAEKRGKETSFEASWKHLSDCNMALQVLPKGLSRGCQRGWHTVAMHDPEGTESLFASWLISSQWAYQFNLSIRHNSLS